MCCAWSSARVGGLYFMSWALALWIFLQKLYLDAFKNKQSGKILLYPVKQAVVLFIGLRSKMSVKCLTLLQMRFES